ncbi:MAG: energy transducer TonB [Myxococcales bacterium]|nr:energy transducer TonB [Myxococcales bacterium]
MPSQRRRVPAGTRILEVIIRFGEDPLAHHTLAPGETLTVGPSADCDVIVSSEVVDTPTELVRVDAAGATIGAPLGCTATHVDPDGLMTSAPGSGNSFAIDSRCGAMLELGQVNIEMRWTAAAERVGSRKRFDWRSQRGTAFSVGIHLLVLIFVAAIPPTGYAITGNNQEINARYLKILTMPKEQDVIPPWMKKPVAGGGGGASKAAAGPESKMGDKKSQRRNRRVAVKGTAKSTQPAGAVDPERTAILGVIASLRGDAAAIFDPNKKAFGKDDLTALGNLEGILPGDARGDGGLGVQGTGNSGGGCIGPDCGLIGTGKLATICSGPGDTCNRGRYKGPGIGDGKPGGGKPKPHKISIIARDPETIGGLSKAIIRRHVRKHLNEVRYCYQKELGNNRGMTGRVVVRFMITGSGRVGSAVVKRTTLKNNNVESCLTQAVRRWEFPQPKGAGLVDVSYPFIFRTVRGR